MIISNLNDFNNIFEIDAIIYRYLQTKFGLQLANQKFSEAIQIFEDAKALAEIVGRRLPV